MRSSVAVVGVLALLACGPGLKEPEIHYAGKRALTGDSADIEGLLRGSVVNGGLWFDDAICAGKFGTAGEVAAAQLSEFARCLAGLHLHVSRREDALADVIVMTYDPGFEIEARILDEEDGPHLVWIGYGSQRSSADAPSITPDALEALRITGEPNGPLDPSVAAGLEIDPVAKDASAFAWVRLCLDETGHVDKARAYEMSSEKAAAAFLAAANAWTFRPFTRNGGAMPVCAMLRMSYPASAHQGAETLPLPPPPSRSGKEPLVFGGAYGVKYVEGKRIAGEKLVVPDDRTKIRIAQKHNHRLQGTFRVCIDETGHVESVLPLRTTGYPTYDHQIFAAIQKWIYSPYAVDGLAVPVCTAVTFIYHQS